MGKGVSTSETGKSIGVSIRKRGKHVRDRDVHSGSVWVKDVSMGCTKV